MINLLNELLKHLPRRKPSKKQLVLLAASRLLDEPVPPKNGPRRRSSRHSITDYLTRDERKYIYKKASVLRCPDCGGALEQFEHGTFPLTLTVTYICGNEKCRTQIGLAAPIFEEYSKRQGVLSRDEHQALLEGEDS